MATYKYKIISNSKRGVYIINRKQLMGIVVYTYIFIQGNSIFYHTEINTFIDTICFNTTIKKYVKKLLFTKVLKCLIYYNGQNRDTHIGWWGTWNIPKLESL